MNNDYICCFTGHRDIPDKHMIHLPVLLEKTIREQCQKGARIFRTGGAIGFDTLAALKCLEIKKKYPSLPITLELCLPCKDQTNGWSEQEKHVYNFVLSQADRVTYEQEVYTAGCMYARNRRLVDGSHVCVAYLSSNHGGTAYTCNYAKQKGVRVINLFERIQTNTDK